ncbi:hypothetical protein JAO29_14705 [Edaphobacter sp. HDX4]|uniref:hypothetical protein n=1 Tax=Edaphobacter sp. HDX4 TaxID=2794064 RepID=UPI002FE63D7A
MRTPVWHPISVLIPSRESSPANHPPHIGLQQGTIGQLTAASLARADGVDNNALQ